MEQGRACGTTRWTNRWKQAPETGEDTEGESEAEPQEVGPVHSSEEVLPTRDGAKGLGSSGVNIKNNLKEI